MSSWARGREEILGMIERGELEHVMASSELAERLLSNARQHVSSADLLAGSDPYLAYAAVYDAIRKALSGLLQIQGLRATTAGGHLAVVHAVQAQFGPSMGHYCDRWIGSGSLATKPNTRDRPPTSTKRPCATTFPQPKLSSRLQPKRSHICRRSLINLVRSIVSGHRFRCPS